MPRCALPWTPTPPPDPRFAMRSIARDRASNRPRWTMMSVIARNHWRTEAVSKTGMSRKSSTIRPGRRQVTRPALTPSSSWTKSLDVWMVLPCCSRPVVLPFGRGVWPTRRQSRGIEYYPRWPWSCTIYRFCGHRRLSGYPCSDAGRRLCLGNIVSVYRTHICRRDDRRSVGVPSSVSARFPCTALGLIGPRGGSDDPRGERSALRARWTVPDRRWAFSDASSGRLTWRRDRWTRRSEFLYLSNVPPSQREHSLWSLSSRRTMRISSNFLIERWGLYINCVYNNRRVSTSALLVRSR
jgi:hypothetical protein